MRILLTGGAGFIGTHVAERLAERGEVVLFDNLRRDSLSLFPKLRENKNVRFVKGDVLDAKALADAAAGCEAIVHLAAIAGVSSYYERPLQTLQVNLLGTVAALDAATAAKARRFVYLSSSEVFGAEAAGVDERAPHRLGGVSDKRWVYATSKLASEQFVMRTAENKGFEGVILRPFNVYGPRQTGEGAIANWCTAACEGKPLLVYGEGLEKRSWCYVSDFVETVLAALDRAEAAGGDFNIGNPDTLETTIGLAERLARIAPGTKIERKPMPHAPILERWPVIGKARRLLSFSPKVGLDEGLRKTLEWRRGLVGAKA